MFIIESAAESSAADSFLRAEKQSGLFQGKGGKDDEVRYKE
ncbi:hypothetical protein [Paenibacillus lemnae]|nr:hypothetical protein [Paenibacillus lemnae]